MGLSLDQYSSIQPADRDFIWGTPDAEMPASPHMDDIDHMWHSFKEIFMLSSSYTPTLPVQLEIAPTSDISRTGLHTHLNTYPISGCFEFYSASVGTLQIRSNVFVDPNNSPRSRGVTHGVLGIAIRPTVDSANQTTGVSLGTPGLYLEYTNKRRWRYRHSSWLQHFYDVKLPYCPSHGD